MASLETHQSFLAVPFVRFFDLGFGKSSAVRRCCTSCFGSASVAPPLIRPDPRNNGAIAPGFTAIRSKNHLKIHASEFNRSFRSCPKKQTYSGDYKISRPNWKACCEVLRCCASQNDMLYSSHEHRETSNKSRKIGRFAR